MVFARLIFCFRATNTRQNSIDPHFVFWTSIKGILGDNRAQSQKSKRPIILRIPEGFTDGHYCDIRHKQDTTDSITILARRSSYGVSLWLLLPNDKRNSLMAHFEFVVSQTLECAHSHYPRLIVINLSLTSILGVSATYVIDM